MPALEKAKLQKVQANENETPIGDPVEVQFNPSSLTLKLKNQVAGGRSNARQRRQQTGASSNVLTMDLIFDTADEGTVEAPVSVRTKTGLVEQFVVPAENNPDPPPRLRFEWDQLVLTGIVEEVNVEFDLFAANGTPLRAKVGLSIKEQKPSYQFLRGGAGAQTSSGATQPGENSAAASPGAGTNAPGGGPGAGPGAGDGDQVAPALEDETPAEFASRNGLDPAAWRGLAADLADGIGFEAGASIGFSASLSASVGIGVSVGVQADVGVSLDAALGLSAGGNAGAAIDGDAAGRAIASAGGVASAINTVASGLAAAASTATAEAFGQPVPSAGAAAGPARPGGAAIPTLDRAPLAGQSRARTSTQTGSPAAAGASVLRVADVTAAPDPRSTSFGFGVPLQPLRATFGALNAGTLCTPASGLGRRLPPIRQEASTPPWQALPAIDRSRAAVDALERTKAQNPCGLLTSHCGCPKP